MGKTISIKVLFGGDAANLLSYGRKCLPGDSK